MDRLVILCLPGRFLTASGSCREAAWRLAVKRSITSLLLIANDCGASCCDEGVLLLQSPLVPGLRQRKTGSEGLTVGMSTLLVRNLTCSLNGETGRCEPGGVLCDKRRVVSQAKRHKSSDARRRLHVQVRRGDVSEAPGL